MRSSHVWYDTRRMLWPLKMGPTRSPEMSVTKYQPTPHNIQEEGKPQSHHSGSLKSRFKLGCQYF
jgi:hypothetical protein